MKRLILLTLILILYSSANSQVTKAKLADSIPGWFRFEKGRHGLNFFAGMNVFERRYDGVVNASIYQPAITLGYAYVPINRLVLKADLLYSYSFSQPIFDSQDLLIYAGPSYCIWGKNRFFMLPGVDLFISNHRYRIHPDYPAHSFFNDSVANQTYSRFLYAIRPNINVGMYVGNNMLFQMGVGYNIKLNMPAGKPPIVPIMFNINFSYYFPMKKYKEQH